MRGFHLDPVMRRLVHFYWSHLCKTAEEIHDELFIDSATSITINRIKDLGRWFDNPSTVTDIQDINEFLYGVNTRKRNAGRHRLLGEDERRHLKWLLRRRANRTLKDLTRALYALLDSMMNS